MTRSIFTFHHAAEGDAGGIVDADVNEFSADTKMAVDDASSASGDAMPDRADFAELFDIEVDDFARLLAFVRRTASAGSKALSLFSPNRRKMRLTVASETPTSAAIALPVRR